MTKQKLCEFTTAVFFARASWMEADSGATSTIAVRYPALAPNGLHYGAFAYWSVQEATSSTFARVSRRLVTLLRGLYEAAARARVGPTWTLQPEDVVFLFNGVRRSPDETLQQALDAAVAQHGAQSLSQPLATHPDVRMVLSVIITNAKLPTAVLQLRVPMDQVNQMIRAGQLRLTSPTGVEAPDDPGDPCPVCLHDMRGIDGCLLSCGHALHSDCISGWANAAVVPSCPLCRTPCH